MSAFTEPLAQVRASFEKLRSAGRKSDILKVWCDDGTDALDRVERLATDMETALDPVAIAKSFHENYERLAPAFGYVTRRASAVPWDEVPEQNRALMVATVGAVLAAVLSAREEGADTR